MRAHANEAGSQPALVVVQRGAPHLAPFFCVHGAGGNVLNFRALSRRMATARPFYGLQASGVDGVSRPHESIQAMARTYLAEMRGRQPRGPYLLAGYSGGGIVAFEMARLLTEAEESVGLLGLIDTMHPKARVRRADLVTRAVRLRREGLAFVASGIRRRYHEATRALNLRRVGGYVARGEVVPFALRELHLVQNFRRAAAAYRPRPWPGRATLFRVAEVAPMFRSAGPAYQWEEDVLGGIDVVPVPGGHHTLLARENVDVLARALDVAIERAVSAHALRVPPA